MNSEKKNLIYFGYGLGIISAFFAAGGILKHGMSLPQAALVICSIVFVVTTAVRWEALRPAYRGWMKAAGLIGAVVSTVILSVFFFCVFAPIGLLFRLIGKDHLQRKLEPEAKTYWIKRPPAELSREQYKRQF